MRLRDKVAIITGAASGMGAATARRFGQEGAKVVIADMLTEEGKAVADSINATGGEAMFSALNVTDEAGWKHLVDETVRIFGKLDILVNNAGISGSATNDLLDSGLL
jgi:NAD(P)-dependent dehydrogenase (short-subunit alcohol dehydrogenase family)